MLTRIVFLLALLPFPSFGQDQDRFQVRTTKLSDSVHLLQTGAGGNLGLCIGAEGALLVDSDYAEVGEKIKAAAAKLGDGALKYVINTHWHFDHVGGNAFFRNEGCRIVAHENVRLRMAGDQHIDIIDRDVPASPEEALPDITFRGSMTIHLNGEEIAVTHFPGAHTDGDAVVHFKRSNVIHMGDLFFNCGYPFIDVGNGGRIDGVIAALETVLKLCDDETRIIPGHGPLASKADLEDYLGMVKEFRGIVAREMKAGKNLETIRSENPTRALDEIHGSGAFPPELFTEMVYRSLLRE